MANDAYGIKIIDVMDKSNPVVAGYYDTPGYSNDVVVKDSIIYLADGSSLQIFKGYGPLGVKSEKEDITFDAHPSNLKFYNGAIHYNTQTVAYVDLILYNILGQEVKILEKSFKTKGEHSVKVAGISSGVYIAKLKTSKNTAVLRFVYLK